MTEERFNELLQGPLHHPLIPFQLTRLVLALRAVVQATGEAGAAALEAHCAARETQDAAHEGTVTRARTRLGKRLVAGLCEIERLAEADAAADPGRYPASHPIWGALQWLTQMSRRATRRGGRKGRDQTP